MHVPFPAIADDGLVEITRVVGLDIDTKGAVYFETKTIAVSNEQAKGKR
jgi:hypothetical protein